MFFRRSMAALILSGASMLSAQQVASASFSQQPAIPFARAEVTGTVVDALGAVIAGATVLLSNTRGSVRKTTQTGTSGDFAFSGVPHGSYSVTVSMRGFQARNLPVVIGDNEISLRIALAVSGVSTSIDVQGREDDLTGIASSATQGTVGAAQLQDRPILRSGEVLETVPGLIITQHAGGGKANQYFLRGFNLDHGTDFAISSTTCR